jgi:ABC-type multidrug transport system ATPase subunit
MSADGRIARVAAHKVVKTYGATAALRGVSVALEPGLTLVEGANGSGKTTLLRIVGTLLKPTSGRVEYAPFGEDAAQARGQIGWVSHEPLSYGDLSGRANVALAAELYGLDAKQAWARVEERFELGRFAERPLRTFSRGQRQRIALARALVHEPTLLLLDEPTTGLDKAGVARLLAVLEDELRRRAIVVVVTHEPDVFAAMAGRRVVLDRGRIAS